MKTASQILILTTVALLIGVGVGCGEKKANSVKHKKNCKAGSIWSSRHSQCLQQCAQAGYGVDPHTRNCVSVSVSANQIWTGRLVIIRKEIYRRVLEDYRVCDFYSSWNWGRANCKTWDDHASLSIQTHQGRKPPVDGAVTIFAYNNGSLYQGGVPISINGHFYLINNSSGFELRSSGRQGTPSYNDVIRAIVDDKGAALNTKGYILDRFRVRLLYNNQEFAYSEVSHQ